MKLHKKIVSVTMAALAAASLAVLPAKAQSSTHTVQSGEYLSGIAAAYGVSTEELRAWNGLVSDMIYVGDVLVINGSGQGTSTGASTASAATGGVHTVTAGDTLYTIAQRYGTTVDSLKAWNGLTSDWLTVGMSLAVYGDAVASSTYTTTTTQYGYHTVQPGEYLEAIANAYGVTIYDLMAWNGLASDWLMPGDVLSVGGYANGAISTPTYSKTISYDTSVATGNYTVVSGDTLSTIASAYGTTVDHLMSINGLYSTYLQVGDVLYVPGAASTTSTTSTSDSQNTSEDSTDDANETESDQNETDNLTTEEKEEGIKAKHTVVEGDNLFRIANKYGVTVHNLKLWNNLGDNDAIHVGDELIIKDSAYEPKKHKVVEEDTIDSIAEEYDTTVERLIEWNDLVEGEDLEVDAELIVADPEPVIHTVQTGETLTQIAEHYNVSTEELREWNDLPAASVVVNGKLIVSNPNGEKSTAQSILPTSAEETTEESVTEETTTEETTIAE